MTNIAVPKPPFTRRQRMRVFLSGFFGSGNGPLVEVAFKGLRDHGLTARQEVTYLRRLFAIHNPRTPTIEGMQDRIIKLLKQQDLPPRVREYMELVIIENNSSPDNMIKLLYAVRVSDANLPKCFAAVSETSIYNTCRWEQKAEWFERNDAAHAKNILEKYPPGIPDNTQIKLVLLFCKGGIASEAQEILESGKVTSEEARDILLRFKELGFTNRPDPPEMHEPEVSSFAGIPGAQ